MGRNMRRAASGSPTMVSLMGSQTILRPHRMAMSETWLMMSERTASAMWLTGWTRVRMASRKLPPWPRLTGRWTSVGPMGLLMREGGSLLMPPREMPIQPSVPRNSV